MQTQALEQLGLFGESTHIDIPKETTLQEVQLDFQSVDGEKFSRYIAKELIVDTISLLHDRKQGQPIDEDDFFATIGWVLAMHDGIYPFGLAAQVYYEDTHLIQSHTPEELLAFPGGAPVPESVPERLIVDPRDLPILLVDYFKNDLCLFKQTQYFRKEGRSECPPWIRLKQKQAPA